MGGKYLSAGSVRKNYPQSLDKFLELVLLCSSEYKVKPPVILNVTYHRQNYLESKSRDVIQGNILPPVLFNVSTFLIQHIKSETKQSLCISLIKSNIVI
jgi:hypothetical protein